MDPFKYNALCLYARSGFDFPASYTLDETEALLRRIAESWQQHPDYQFVQDHCPGNPANPYCFVVCQHEPGVDRRKFSYVIGPIMEVTGPNRLDWARQRLGEPVGVVPVPYEVTVDNPYRIGWLSYSLKGTGMAYWSRMRLRELLPRRFHKLITLARSVNHKPKWRYLHKGPGFTHNREVARKPSLQPEWYRNATKGELFFEKDVDPELRRQLTSYISEADFWRAATGRVDHPDDINQLVTNYKKQAIQLELF